MSCIYCDSDWHFGENCDKFLSIQSRRNALKSKISMKQHASKFQVARKCHFCFSRKHHSGFCAEETDSTLFVPKIDSILLTRFLQSLNVSEQRFLAFKFPVAFRSIKAIKPLIISRTYDGRMIKKENKNSYMIIGEMRFGASHFTDAFFAAINSKIVIIRACRIVLYNIMQIKPKDFALIVTKYTTSLYCSGITGVFEDIFGEIVHRVPNIEEFEFYNSNFSSTGLWPAELLKCNTINNFKQFVLNTFTLDFDYEALAKFMETKCHQNAIFQFFGPPVDANESLAKHFVEISENTFTTVPKLMIKRWIVNDHIISTYIVKKP